MDINKRISELYDAIHRSDFENKADLELNAGLSLAYLSHYFDVISNEKFEYLRAHGEDINDFIIRVMELERSEAGYRAVNACGWLNELCHKLNIDVICDFDTSDIRKVAEFCGLFRKGLYSPYIDSDELELYCQPSADNNTLAEDVFLSVFKDKLLAKLNRRFADIEFTCHDAYFKESKLEGTMLCFDYEDSRGFRETKCLYVDGSGIGFGQLHIYRVVEEFYWAIASEYLAKEDVNTYYIPGSTVPHEKFEELIKLFYSEFGRWCAQIIRATDGNYDELSRDICEIMSDKFITDGDKLAEVLPTLDPEYVEKELSRWSGPGNFDYERFEAYGEDDVASWLLTKKDDGRKFQICLSKRGYFNFEEKTKLPNGRFPWTLSYSMSNLAQYISEWVDNKFAILRS